MHAEFFEAVEGRSLTSDDVEHFGMRKCKDYRHESGRDLTFGEVGLGFVENRGLDVLVD